MRNGFELLYSDRKKVNQRRSFAVSPYPIPEVAPKPNCATPIMLSVTAHAKS